MAISSTAGAAMKVEEDYLALRQRLKEQFKKKLKKEAGCSTANDGSLHEAVKKKKEEKENSTAMDCYDGSFFGPSEPVIISRGLSQKKGGSLLRRIHKWSRRDGQEEVEVENLEVKRVEQIKHSRDYSFLYSDDDKAAAAEKVPPPDNLAATKPEPPLSTTQTERNCPWFTKVSVVVGASSQKKVHAPVPLSSKLHPSVSRQSFSSRNKGEYQGREKPKEVMPKQVITRRPPPETSARGSSRDERRPRKRHYDDDPEKAFRMIRNMFRYDPRKYRDYGDDRNMEANFHDIMKEERRSAKIGRREDEEELRKIAEEERRERLRKEAKRRKLSIH